MLLDIGHSSPEFSRYRRRAGRVSHGWHTAGRLLRRRPGGASRSGIIWGRARHLQVEYLIALNRWGAPAGGLVHAKG